MSTVNNNIAIKLPKEIYFHYLLTVNGVAFTSREIDIIACVLQGRTAKRIAFLLGISPKTVENHLRNIMLKINCSSREKIIDFIEKSGKFNYIKYYYSSLIIKLAFELELKQVLSLVQTQQPISCTIVYHNLIDEHLKLLQQLLEHLKIINVQTACIRIQDDMNIAPFTIKSNEYIVCFISKDVSEYIKKVGASSIPWFLQEKRAILLLLETCHDLEKLLRPCYQINLTLTQNYYFATFSMLKLFFPMIDFTNNITCFEKYCVNLAASEQIIQSTSGITNDPLRSTININKSPENSRNLISIYMEQTVNNENLYYPDASVNHLTDNNSVSIIARKMAKNDVSEFKIFLQLVAEGEQELAEQLLKQHPNFSLNAGDIVDLSKRSFTEITAFQYALWSLDWNMWSMLQRYLPNKHIYTQIESFHQNLSQQHGKHAGTVDGPILALILSLEKYIKLCKNETNSKEACEYWNHQVGRSQLMLPVHLVNEYCSGYWYAEKNVRHKMFFTLGSVKRIHNVYINGILEDWYSAYNNKLGKCFAYVRHSLEYPEGQDAFGVEMPLGEFGGRRVQHDMNVLKNLHDARAKQFFTFISKYI